MSPAVFQGRSLWGSTFMCSCKVSVGSWHCTVSWMVDVLSSWSYEFPSTQAMYPKMTYYWVPLIEQVTLFGNTPFRMVSAQWSFFLIFIYSIMRDRERERGRETGRGRSRLHPGSPTWDSVPYFQDHALGQRLHQTAEPPGPPSPVILCGIHLVHGRHAPFALPHIISYKWPHGWSFCPATVDNSSQSSSPVNTFRYRTTGWQVEFPT